ncbi:hypothetical protein [Lysinibacillus sp. fls2-241-R2A-57]|nr:hypothetical protein [Lysinibacillus sp. fls2-241-R2A-57]
MRAIGKHMKLSSTTIFRGRYNILNQMMEKEEETAIAVSFYYLNNSK